MSTTGSTTAAVDPLRIALEQALGAQYDVLSLLGRGGMGAVYLARERLLERLVAIKVLPSEQADGEGRERFLREARTVAQLSHPNIVPLLSFGEMGGTLFYIMRYVDGEPLERRLRREGSIPPNDARQILREVADALIEAHRLGIVHRDLKPDNVMIDRATGRPMLTDFGIARQPAASSTLTGTGMIVGTPQYMSPEQASGDRAIDGRSDLYSLGVMGYRMVTGRLPFSGGDVQELLMKQITMQATPITTHAPDAPMDLSDALMRCLEKDPARRWADAASFKFALHSTEVDAAALPESLETVPRGGTRALELLYICDVGLTALFAYTRDPEWLAMMLGITIFGLGVPLVATLVQIRRSGLSWKRVLPIAFWPGARSALWWPRRLRPPGDIFDRLPKSIRLGRIWQSIGVALITHISVPVLLVAAIAGRENILIRRVFLIGGSGSILAGLLMILASSIASISWRKRWRLTTIESSKLLAEPTHGSRFWERPAIAALVGADHRSGQTGPMTIDAMVRAIHELVAGFPATMASIAVDAANAARDLADEVRALDRRIAELAQQADQAERRRLDERLALLGPEQQDESDITRQMRGLLQGQERLFIELGSRRAELQGRRDRLHEQLRTLWLQMANFRHQLSDDSDGSAAAISEQIRELSRSIQRRVSALKDAERVTAAPQR